MRFNSVSIGSENDLSPAPGYYGIQCCLIVNYTLQWVLNQNTQCFFHSNAFENVVWKLLAISFRPHYILMPWLCWLSWPNHQTYISIGGGTRALGIFLETRATGDFCVLRPGIIDEVIREFLGDQPPLLSHDFTLNPTHSRSDARMTYS